MISRKAIRADVRPALVLLFAALFFEPAAAQADYYREQIFLPSEGRNEFSGFTPHANPTQYEYIQGAGGTVGRSSQFVEFSSRPAPYVYAEAIASMGMNGLGVQSAVQASLDYGFWVTGSPNSYVRIGINGRYELYNSSFLSQTSTGLSANVYGWDYSRADQIGFSVVCSGRPDLAECNFTTAGFPSQHGSISGDLRGTGVNLNMGNGAEGNFSGAILVPTDASGRGRGIVSLRTSVHSVDAFGSHLIERSRAFIDPELFVHPDFLLLNPTAKIEITTGVGNAMVPVPESSTAAMLFGGIVCLAFRFRKSKTRREV